MLPLRAGTAGVPDLDLALVQAVATDLAGVVLTVVSQVHLVIAGDRGVVVTSQMVVDGARGRQLQHQHRCH